MVQCCTRKVFIPVLLSRILLQFAAVPSPVLLACAFLVPPRALSHPIPLILLFFLSDSQYSPIHPPPGFSFHPFFSDTPKYPFFCRTIDWLLASSYCTVLVVLLKTRYSSVSQRSTGVQQPTVHSPQSTVHSPQSTVHSPQSTVHSPQPTAQSPPPHPPTAQSTAQSTRPTSLFRNAPLTQFHFLPRLTSPIASHTIHPIHHTIPPITLSWPHLTTRHNSICFSLSSASASASVFASAAHYRLSPIYLGLYPLALLCTHCTYIHTGPENRKSPILKYGFKFSYTDSSVVCVVCAAIPRLSLPPSRQLSTPNPPPATTTSSSASNVAS
jgi:hypothetical protein